MIIIDDSPPVDISTQYRALELCITLTDIFIKNPSCRQSTPVRRSNLVGA